MKKSKKQVLVLVGLVGFATVFGCSQNTTDSVEAGSQGLFEKVSNEVNFKVYKQKDTGCYFTVTDSNSNYGIVTQVFKEDGLPYCKK